MHTLEQLYTNSLALLTDLYQLTMAYAYWKSGTDTKEAVFHLSFRENPYQGGFAVGCGLGHVVGVLTRFGFDASDLEYLSGLRGNDGERMFEDAFLDYLREARFACDVDAVPEGTVVFPHEPLVRVRGPILQCQILETVLLNILCFQTLIATKAARVCQSARGESVLEFGLRRAQGFDGALAASRAAYVGGCAGTSNALAGKLFDIPVKGTHAHSWVLSFNDEKEAFETYADAMPNNCLLLVDTFDSLNGVRKAVEIGRKLRQRGHEMVGIRLDSGDLAFLSIEARRILDEAGFPEAVIVGSNDLDEHLIASLKEEGARINVWGVGTRLATAFDQPALGGVYKLSCVRSAGNGDEWVNKVKLSEQAVKVSTPGILQTRRFRRGDQYVADAIYDENLSIADGCTIVDPMNMTRRKHIAAGTECQDLLVPVFRGGELVYDVPSVHAAKEKTQAELSCFHNSIKRRVNPHEYPVGLEARLHEMKTRLVLQARGDNGVTGR